MTGIALQGKLVDLKTAVEETVEEKWQTESLKKQIEKAGLRKKGFMMPLDAVDVTERDFYLAKQFMPEIQLSGVELRSERKSKAWGGSYFRVLESADENNSRCIQWIYVWTKQRFFISLWMTVLPLFVLGLLGTLIYSFLSFSHAILSIVLIGGIFFILGASALYDAIKGITKGRYFFSNGQLFIVFGLVFWALLGEIYISKGSQEEALIEGAITWHELPVGQEIIDTISKTYLDHALSISWVGLLFFTAAIIALILWKWEPPSFTHATHDMDWAPFFIYIRKKGNEWQLEKVRYDNFHYFADTLSIEQLKQKNAVTKDQRPRFEIPNFWHSFRTNGGFNDWLTVFFGVLILVITVLIAGLSFSTDALSHEIVRFVLIPILLFFGAYLVFASWPTDVVSKKIDLSDPIYYLTENRLRIFWNLRGEEPALKVRSKLQDPFMDDEDFGTFRDDLEQIVFYNLLPKIRELEQKEFFKQL